MNEHSIKLTLWRGKPNDSFGSDKSATIEASFGLQKETKFTRQTKMKWNTRVFRRDTEWEDMFAQKRKEIWKVMRSIIWELKKKTSEKWNQKRRSGLNVMKPDNLEETNKQNGRMISNSNVKEKEKRRQPKNNATEAISSQKIESWYNNKIEG